MTRALPWLALLFVTLMASGTFAIIKYLIGYVVPVELFLLRFLPASLASIVLILVFYRKSVKAILPKFWWFFLLREGLAVLGFHLTLIYCETVLPAGVAALIVGTWPVMTIFIASLLIGEQLTAKKVVGALLAFAGVAAIVVLGADSQAAELDISAGRWVRYSLILLIAPFSAAVVTVISRWYLNRKGAELPDCFLFSILCRAPSGLYALIVYLLFIPAVPLFEKLSQVPPLVLILAAVLAFYNSLLGFWLWNWALQRIKAGNVASATYIQTALALVIAWLFLGESIGPVKIIGAVAIIVGVLIANIEEFTARPPPMEHPRIEVPISSAET